MCDWEKIKNLKNKNLRSENAKICSAEIKNLKADTAAITNLNVCSINGKAVCAAEYQNIVPTFQIVDYQINGQPADPFNPDATPVQPPNTEGFNPQVWDTLWQNTVENLYNSEFGLKARLQCGRLTEKYIQNSNNCTVCPKNDLAFCAPSCGSFLGNTLEGQPFVIEITEVNAGSSKLEIGSILSGDGVTTNTTILGFISGTGGVGTYLLDQENNIPPNTLISLVGGPTPCNCPSGDSLSCPPVPIRILALDTYPITATVPCDSCNLNNQNNPNQQTVNTIMQFLSAVSYNLEVRNLNKALATRVVSVMVQLAYLDENKTPQLKLIDFSNKQFPFTLDSLYGEKFAANILISSDLVKSIVQVMPQIYGNYAAAQIVVYMEEGVEVQFVAPPRKFTRVAENSGASGNAQYLGQTQLQNYSFFAPGTYPITPRLPGEPPYILTLGGGGGGGAGGNIGNLGGGGGGAGGTTHGFDVPNTAAFLVITQVGSGGDSGNGARLNIAPTDGKDGGSTIAYLTDINQQPLTDNLTASGGGGGKASTNSKGGDGGNGLQPNEASSGGGGGGGGNLQGNGGTALGGNGENGSLQKGGNGGYQPPGEPFGGGKGGDSNTVDNILYGGGGGGGGFNLYSRWSGRNCQNSGNCTLSGGNGYNDTNGSNGRNASNLTGAVSVGGGGGGEGNVNDPAHLPGNGGRGGDGFVLLS